MQTFKVYSKGKSWFFWGDENKNVIDQINAKMIAAGSKIRGDYCFSIPEGTSDNGGVFHCAWGAEK